MSIFVIVVCACMVLVCCVVLGYYHYNKNKPTSYLGHIKNFTVPERVERGRVAFGRALQIIFPRVIVPGGDVPPPEDHELREVVVDHHLESKFHGSFPGDVLAEAPPSSVASMVPVRRPPALRRPEMPDAMEVEQPTSPRAMPGAVNESDDEDVTAKAIAPQRTRNSLWRSNVNTEALTVDSADTMTTERLGTISRSPQSGGLTVEHHYPQRSRYDSVFDATNTELESQIFDFGGDDVGAGDVHISAPVAQPVGFDFAPSGFDFGTQHIDLSDLL